MSQKLSRRKIAAYVADRIVSGNDASAALQEAAAYLVEIGRTSDHELLARDIEDALATRGTVVADVTSVSELSPEARESITSLIPSAKKVLLREHHDPTVLGGIRIELPDARYDGTLRHKLDALRETKI